MADTSQIQQLLDWIQQQKPLYLAMKTATLKATEFVGFMVVQNWPIICSWLVYLGRLFLVLFQLWLDCSLRGMGSLLLLDSTAYFVLLWCTVLSTTSMAGLFLVLISLGIACVAEPFLGFAPAIIIIAISGATILWMYGSFWITGAFITIGGSLFTLNHARLALLIAIIFIMYCAKVCTGWFGLLFCMNLAFISNDILIYLLKSNGKENERKYYNKQDEETKSRARNFNEQDEETKSRARNFSEQDEETKSRARNFSEQDEETKSRARNFSEQDEESKSRARNFSEQDEETKSRARNFNNPPRSTSSNGQPSKSHKGRPSDENSQTGQSAQVFGEYGESSQTGQSPKTFGESGKSSQTGQSAQTFGESGKSSQTSQSAQTRGESSTVRLGEADPSPGDEVLHILHSSDHYATLGLSRYEKINFAVLKREYRKKAMLVHPDKNMGNVMAEESFKKLQTAYEVLSDLEKKNAYDEELRRDELTKSFHQKIQCGAQKNGRYNPSVYEKERKDIPVESRRIACRKCNKSHKWIDTNRAKCRARWCQDCQDYHQAKDGDGWMEWSDRIILVGMRQKVETQHAYACIESTIFDVSEWAACQGVNCRPNTHNPSFHVNGTITGNNVVYRSNYTHKGSSHVSMATNIDEYAREEEILEWVHMAFSHFHSVNGLQEDIRMKSSFFGRRNLKRNGTKRW